ncbi:hypothetical protein D9M71_393160 [compost metagenome]
MLFTLAVQVQFVMRSGVLDRWLQEPIGRCQRQADFWRCIKTIAIGTGQAEHVLVDTTTISAYACINVAVFVEHGSAFQITIESNRLGLITEVKATRMIRQHSVDGDLRQSVIRGDLRNSRQLKGLYVQARSVAVATPGQRTLLVKEVSTFDANLIRLQILEIERIADIGVVDLSQQTLVKAALVLPVDHPAFFFVVRLQLAIVILVIQESTTKLTFAGLGQVAELAFHQQAAIGHVAWIQGGVVVWRQVEVVRRDQHEAGVTAGTERWRQEAGLAAVVDREVDIRRVEHRNILDPQGDVGRGTETGGRVQGDVVALELPGVAVRFTGGVGTVLEADDGVFGTLGVQRATADT